MSRFQDSAAESDGEDGIDISPLIDCIFILLIFFIVTATFVEETGVEVNRPVAASSKMLEKSSILIAITKEGDVVYGGRSIGILGVRPQVERILTGAKGEQIPVIVLADTQSHAELLVQVVGEAKAAGARNVSIATERA